MRLIRCEHAGLELSSAVALRLFLCIWLPWHLPPHSARHLLALGLQEGGLGLLRCVGLGPKNFSKSIWTEEGAGAGGATRVRMPLTLAAP